MTKDEALDLALEALKLIEAQDQGCGGRVTEAEAWRSAQSIARKAIAAIKQARSAPPVQEPVACDGDFPEGFDESFGIPAQALRQANAALCEVTNNRMWDVPALAERMMLFRTHTTPPAAPVQEQDLREELDATNRQVEILSDALAESRREVAALKVNAALDKKAENARELGLDYEPPCKTGSQCTSKCQQCVVQEPVAWRYRGILHEFDPSDWAEGPVTPLYKTPPAAQRQWVEVEQVKWDGEKFIAKLKEKP